MLEFVQYQDQTSQFYTDLMGKLEHMNRDGGGGGIVTKPNVEIMQFVPKCS